MKYIFSILFVFICYLSSHAQPELNHWYFSSQLHLSFSSGSPIVTSGGQMSVSEGVSTISDANGQLLFYTDGIRVYNRNHVLMTNGNNLSGGGGSSTQASLIVPKTDDGQQYYIFTTGDEYLNVGLQYSIVDMTLNGGNGDVTVKNSPLVTPVCEQVTAVRHCNRKDYWVITHHYGSDAFYAYHVSATGVNSTPVISHTGVTVHVDWATHVGTLKASPNGKKLVATHTLIGTDLLDFDNKTGIVSNGGEIFGSATGIQYGAEFSADGTKLYLAVNHFVRDNTFYTGIFQYDLNQPDIASIRASKYQLVEYPVNNEFGSMQRGPDGKIYVPHFHRSYLHVINSPNIAGAGCNFVSQGLALTNTADFALANFINSYGVYRDSFLVAGSGFCTNIPVQFTYTIAGGVTSLLWDFNDPASGFQNNSTDANPVHIFNASGIYEIKLIKYSPCGNDTLRKQVIVGDVTVSLGSDTGICDKSSVVLSPGPSTGNTFLWQDNSTNSTLTATTAGLYWVQVTSNSNGCVKRDSITIVIKPLPIVSLGKDTVLCVGNSILLDAQNSGAGFQWNNGNMTQTLSVTQFNQSMLHWVEVTVDGCSIRDSIRTTPLLKPVFSLGADQYLCPTVPVLLSPELTNVNYQWQNFSTAPTFLVTQEGLYYVDISNNCGTTRDSINFINGPCNIHVPSAFTPNGDGLNDLFRVSGQMVINEFELRVYNRWGETVFYSRNKGAGWDGRLKGVLAPSGIYVWVLKYSQVNDSPIKTIKGTVILLR